MKWYRNSSIWSVLIAASAVALSQFPPLTDWIPNDDLKIKYGDRIGINNAIGLTGYHVNLELENDGNSTLEIEGISLVIKEPSGFSKSYTAETLSTPTASGGYLNLPVTSLELNPNERWSGTVFFNKQISPTEEEKFNKIRLQVSQSINDKIQNQNWEDYNPRALVPAAKNVTDTAINFFESKFDLKKGLHEANIIVQIRNKDTVTEPLEFTLYDYHFELIKAQVADYKYGFGIYLPHQPNKQVYVKVRPNE